MERRRYTRRPSDEPPEIRWSELLKEAMNAPAHLGDTYTRAYEYSYGNQLFLRSQGAREPVASYEGWKKLGRHVTKGSRGLYIIRPITVMSKTEVDEDGKPKTFTKFKPVRGAFTYSQTEGEPLPEVPPREWSRDKALGELGIKLVAYRDLSLNQQGYSYDRNIAINPVAKYPLKTTWHEIGHIEAGHTAPENVSQYEKHRGLWEFEAESTAYLGMHELGLDDQMNPAESRAYIQSWLEHMKDVATERLAYDPDADIDELHLRPPDSSIRKIFRTVDRILRAGYVDQEESTRSD